MSVVATPGTPYTWANAPGTWSSVDATKTWASFAPTAFAALCAEAWATVEKNLKRAAPVAAEGWRTGDARAAAIARVVRESLSCAESLSLLSSWLHSSSESFLTSETDRRAIGQAPFFEAFQVLDPVSPANLYAQVLRENLTMPDAFDRVAQFLSIAVEDLRTAEAAPRAIATLQREAFDTKEADLRALLKTLREGWKTAEGLQAQASWIRVIAETLHTTDTSIKALAKALAEAWNTRDAALRNAGGVVGDIAVSAAPLSVTDFANLVSSYSPVGFAPFKELIAGDYQYQDAIVWLRLLSQRTSSDTLSISQASLEVDVPDQFDSGTVAVPAGGKLIPFNRTFNIAPEVVAQVVGGLERAYADVTQITTTGFFVNCVSVADTSKSVAGSVTYNASGY